MEAGGEEKTKRGGGERVFIDELDQGMNMKKPGTARRDVGSGPQNCGEEMRTPQYCPVSIGKMQ